MIAHLDEPAHPRAVGAGVVAFLNAAADRPPRETEEDWIHLCLTAAAEAHTEVMRNPPPKPGQERGYVDRLLDDLRREEQAAGRGPREKDELGRWLPAQASEAPAEPLEPAQVELVRLEGAELEHAAHVAAATAFLCCMPPLTTRRRIRAYIACAAVAVQHGYVTAAVATKLLYAAQVASAANPKRAPRAGKRVK